MRPKPDTAVPLPATLHRVDKQAIGCLISQVSDTGVCIKPDPSAGSKNTEFKQLRKGELAELHIANPSVPTDSPLLIRATIDKAASQLVILAYTHPRDPAVRQLQNWFNPGKTASTGSLDVQLNEMTQQKLQELLDTYVLELESQLLTMADTAGSNDQQSKLLDALKIIRNNSDNIKQSTFKTILSKNEQFHSSKPLPGDQPSGQNYDEMDEEDIALIDLDEFEDWLSMETIIRRANSKYESSINCLEKRYSQLLHRELGRDELPISVSNICNSLKSTFKQYELNPDLMPVLYRIFDETVVGQMAGLYDGLNTTLKSHGILPDIESDIRAQLGSSKQTQPQAAMPGMPGTPGALPGATQMASDVRLASSPQSPDAIPSGFNLADTQKALYGAVQNILNLSRADAGEQTAAGAGQAGLDSAQLIQQLSAIQHNENAVDSIASGTSISELVNQQSGSKISVEVSDIINLVSSLFSKIGNYKQISDSIIKQLKRLEVPIAKTALLENDFFSSSEHPARQLINQMTDLSLNSEMPNQALEHKFESIVDNIIENYDEDSSVYQQALDNIDSLSSQQSIIFNRNTRRIAQTYEGRQKVNRAKRIVAKEISSRLAPPQQPEVLVNFVNNGWREVLQLTYLKEGSDSDLWQQQLENLDQLISWVKDSERNEAGLLIQQDVNLEHETRTFVDLIEQQLNSALPGDYRHQNTINNIADCLGGNSPITMIAIGEEDLTDLNTDIDEDFSTGSIENPELHRWIKRAQSFNVGDEFSYLDDESDQRNIKLAWIGDDHQHFVFVNNRGQKVFDFNLIDLTNELSKGLYLTEEKSEWPLVEKSLYSTVQQAYEQLAYKSTHDELTGLLNRKECDKLLSRVISKAQLGDTTGYLIYSDIDKFSLANDLYGHLAGDQLLTDLSKLIIAAVPEGTATGRMAGNEFLIILEDSDTETCHRIAENIRQAIAGYEFRWQEHTIQLTTSMGISIINEFTEDVVDLLRDTISASRAAKVAGGNRIRDVDHETADISRRQALLGWIDKLNDHLNSDHLGLRAQKIVASDPDISSTHFEILLGIKNEEGVLIPPGDFIEAAEYYNRMQQVDRWVIEQSFAWLNQQKKLGKTLPHISINLSANSINDEQLAEFLFEQFKIYQIPSDHICFEVTETATIANIATAADFIREIKKMGCKFSLDDFGSGNASYQYLRNLPVDFIKIDGAFIKDIHTSKDDYALVKSMREIAHLMGKWTIAEFVENDEIIGILREIGVDFLQGYAIHKPTPITEIELD